MEFHGKGWEDDLKEAKIYIYAFFERLVYIH